MEHCEMYRLLDLGIPVELDVGPIPEVVEETPPLSEQTVPAGLDSRGQCRVDLIMHRRPLYQRHQSSRGDPHGATRRRLPLSPALQHSGAENQHPLMSPQLPVADIKGLIVHEQPDYLAIGDIDDRLPVFGIAVGSLDVGERSALIDPVEISAGHAMRFTLVEVATPTDMAIGQGEYRLALAKHVEVESCFALAPGLDGERWMVDHVRFPDSTVRSGTATPHLLLVLTCIESAHNLGVSR